MSGCFYSIYINLSLSLCTLWDLNQVCRSFTFITIWWCAFLNLLVFSPAEFSIEFFFCVFWRTHSLAQFVWQQRTTNGKCIYCYYYCTRCTLVGEHGSHYCAREIHLPFVILLILLCVELATFTRRVHSRWSVKWLRIEICTQRVPVCIDSLVRCA